MSAHDDVLARIDDTLAGHDQAIDADWEIGPDAMRSRPAGDGDQRWGEDSTRPGFRGGRMPPASAFTVMAQVARVVAERDQAFARLAAVTTPAYAQEKRLATGGDVRQLEAIARFSAALGFTERTRELVRDALTGGLDPSSVARALDVPMHLVAGGLPVPRPSLRLQAIDALGLTLALTRLCEWVLSALERMRAVLDRLDPRPSARRRRATPTRTITVTLGVDVSAFNDGMRRASVTAAEAGASMAAAMTSLVAALNRTLGPDAATTIAHRMDLADIRANGRTELAAAHAWFDQHLDTVYADLGLARDPHLIRGEH